MGEEILEIVRRQFDRWSDGDFDGWAECWDPDVVVTPPAGWPEGDDLHGIDSWWRQAERLKDSWETARVEVDEMRPVGADRVVTRIRYVTRGKEPGISFDTPMGAAFVVRDGKITRARYCWSFDEALEAAELLPE